MFKIFFIILLIIYSLLNDLKIFILLITKKLIFFMLIGN